MEIPFASLLNAGVVALTGVLGVGFGHLLPERVRNAVLSSVGLVVLVVGIDGALGSTNIVIPLIALALGALIGEAIGIEQKLESAGSRLRERFAKHDRGRFVEGFVTATLIAVVGPLAILGAFAEGASGDRELILVKTALDGFMIFSVAAAYGIGVAFSALGILAVQIPLSVVGSVAGSGLEGRVLSEIEATGGLIVCAIGLRLLEIRRLPVASYLPAIALAPVVLWVGDRIV